MTMRYLIGLLLLYSVQLMAQDDPASILETLTETNEKEPVTSTFKTTRVIISHSLETVKKHNLDFRVTHRFSDIAGKAGGFPTFFGFDNSSDIRVSFEYGVTDRLTVAIGRSKMQQMLDAHVKYRLLMQTINNSMPISLTWLSSAGFIPIRFHSDPEKEVYDNAANRFSYVHQAIIGRKFNETLSLELLPTALHRNFIPDSTETNDLFAIGAAGRLKLTRRFSVVADYYYIVSELRKTSMPHKAPLGLGIELETGGHVFSINFTNAAGILENNFLPYTQSDWLKGQFRFGFNISRIFRVYRPKVE